MKKARPPRTPPGSSPTDIFLSREPRIILTRDIGLLKNGLVTHGYWVRSQQPLEQAREILRRFGLRAAVRPFSRCPSDKS